MSTKREFPDAIYAMGREEKAETKAEKGKYTCLRDANHSEFEPMWNRREGKIAEK